MPDSPDIVYRLDASDAIVAVSESWDPFARANAGEQVTAQAVVGRPLWDFVTDPTTREIYRQVLAKIRSGARVQFTLRCDGPACRRRLEMTVTPAGDGGAEFRSRTLSIEDRQAQPLAGESATEGDELLRVCGWCKRVDADGQWLEVEEAMEALQLLERPVLPRITHGMCPACHDRMLATLDAA
ncbi:MAG: PAS domain-containing protein [Gemmatimonadales bacterium]